MQRVIILGGGCKEASFDKTDTTSEIWGINAIRPAWVPRWDRMFNLHHHRLLKLYKWPTDLELKWTREHRKTPFYTVGPWPAGALARECNHIIFPRRVLEKMGTRGGYHCGTFDWLVAFALHLGAEEIVLHGIGLCLEAGEPISARACLEYWCGYAEGKGARVTMVDSDPFHFYHLVKSNLVYSYDDTPIFEDRTSTRRRGEAPYNFQR